MQFIRGFHDTDGIGVRGGEDGRVINGLGKQVLGQLVSIVDGGVGKFAVEKALFQPQLLAGFHIPLCPELMRRGVAAAEIQNVPVAQLVQIFGADVGAPAVISGHIALGLIPEILRQEHRGHLIGISPNILIGLGALGHDENTVHLAAQQQLDHRFFLLQIRSGIAQHNIVPVGTGAHLRVIGQFRHELVVNGRDHQANQVRFLHDHGPGHIVGRVAHLVAELDNTLTGVASNLGTAGQGAGNRGIGDAGCLGNIFQGHAFHIISSFPRGGKS